MFPADMKGSLFLVSAPSGAGKSSLVNALLEKVKGIELSISTTTRAPRPGEVDGREYNFTTVEKFLEAKEKGEFLESALVHGNYYGTSKKWIEPTFFLKSTGKAPSRLGISSLKR